MNYKFLLNTLIQKLMQKFKLTQKLMQKSKAIQNGFKSLERSKQNRKIFLSLKEMSVRTQNLCFQDSISNLSNKHMVERKYMKGYWLQVRMKIWLNTKWNKDLICYMWNYYSNLKISLRVNNNLSTLIVCW